MAEITNLGFLGKTGNQYFADETALYLGIDPNWNLDPSTPDGLKIAADAEIFGNLDEVAQRAYNSKDPSKAMGVELDDIGSITGSRRSLGTPSRVALVLGGVAGSQIMAGDTVDSGNDTPKWTIDATVTIGSMGTVAANATAVVNGATQANVGTINRIVTVRGGWQSVTNNVVAVAGTNIQTDGAFRVTRAASVGRPGNNQIDSMIGELFAVSGVRRVKVYENDTNSATVHPIDNPHGLPANSIAPVIDGGTNDNVALAIYTKKNPGVLLHPAGTAFSVNVTSPRYPSNSKVIRASRPIDVNASMVIEVTNDGTLPSNVDTLITNAILEYTAGTLIPADVGFNIQGFDIGENVPVNRMLTPINQVIGGFGNSYVSALTVNGQSTGSVTIAFNQLAVFAAGNITVSVV